MSNSTLQKRFRFIKKDRRNINRINEEIKFFDYDRKIHWFPTILNKGKFGMIYPEGTKDNWNWKLAEVRKLTKERKKILCMKERTHI